MGWTIRVVNRGVNEVHVTSDPGVFDTDGDGLNDSREYYITYTNASNRATASDKMAIFAYSRQRIVLTITNSFFIGTQIPDAQATIHHTSANLSPNSQREDQEMRKYEPITT